MIRVVWEDYSGSGVKDVLEGVVRCSKIIATVKPRAK